MELPVAEKLKQLIKEVMEDPEYGPKMRCVMKSCDLDLEELTAAVLDYTLQMEELTNEFYSSSAARAALYLHSLVRTSYHQLRQQVVIKYLEQLPTQAPHIVEIGFGVPSRYATEYLSVTTASQLTLIDLDYKAITFGQAVFRCSDPGLLDRVNFRMLNMDDMEYVGNFDAYLFLDSIEHTRDPTGYLRLTVERAPNDARFILSLPICPNPTKMHFIEFLTRDDSLAWLRDCGLHVEVENVVEPIPTTDFFAARIKGGFRNSMVLCRKSAAYGA